MTGYQLLVLSSAAVEASALSYQYSSELGTENRELRTENKEQRTKNKISGTGNRERGTGNREQGGNSFFAIFVKKLAQWLL